MRISTIAPLLFILVAAPAFAAEDARPEHKNWIERVCSSAPDEAKIAEHAQHRADRIAEKLQLTDAEKATFKDLQDTQAKIRADRKAALCANKPDLSSFEKRLAFHQTQQEGRLADEKIVQPKLIAFYDSLDDKQKAEFDKMHKRWGGHGRHHRQDDK